MDQRQARMCRSWCRILFFSELQQARGHQLNCLRLRMPFRTAANTSARSRSPPKTLLLVQVSPSSCDESGFSGVPVRLDVSTELCSNLEILTSPSSLVCESAFTLATRVSASTVTRETSAVLAVGAETGPSAAGTPTTDFGLKRPFNDRVDFLIPRPILRSIREAEDAVDAREMLSVDPVNAWPWLE